MFRLNEIFNLKNKDE
jgi:hypothetical protein